MAANPLNIGCPRCFARPGDPCVGETAMFPEPRRQPRFHQQRYDRARFAETLPDEGGFIGAAHPRSEDMPDPNRADEATEIVPGIGFEIRPGRNK